MFGEGKGQMPDPTQGGQGRHPGGRVTCVESWRLRRRGSAFQATRRTSTGTEVRELETYRGCKCWELEMYRAVTVDVRLEL